MRRRGLLLLVLALLVAMLLKLGLLDSQGPIPAFRGGQREGVGSSRSGASAAALGADAERGAGREEGGVIALLHGMLDAMLESCSREASQRSLGENLRELSRTVRADLEDGRFHSARYELDRFRAACPRLGPADARIWEELDRDLRLRQERWLAEQRGRARGALARGDREGALAIAAALVRAGAPGCLEEARGIWGGVRRASEALWTRAQLGSAWRERWLAFLEQPQSSESELLAQLARLGLFCADEETARLAAALPRELGLVAWGIRNELIEGALVGERRLPSPPPHGVALLARRLFHPVGLEGDASLFALAIVAAGAGQPELAARALAGTSAGGETRAARELFISALGGS